MSEGNKALAARYAEEVWNKGNVALIDVWTTEDVVDHSLPLGFPEGRVGLKAQFAMFQEAFRDWKMTIEELIVDGDWVIERWTATGTHVAPLMGIPATGKPFAFGGISIMRFENGRVAEIWAQTDTLSLLKHLGAAPTFW